MVCHLPPYDESLRETVAAWQTTAAPEIAETAGVVLTVSRNVRAAVSPVAKSRPVTVYTTVPENALTSSTVLLPVVVDRPSEGAHDQLRVPGSVIESGTYGSATVPHMFNVAELS